MGERARQIADEMIYNLCDNAIKYNRPGGTVCVRLEPREEEAVALSVEDTGIGIPQEHQGRVFERFYRVDKNRSREIGGTGLGLSIVKHGALYHGAALYLDSTPGVGTKITVVFPRHRPEQTQ
ncbi:MAG: sensor histidine kinase [Oscillospiraceae bacterium]